LTDGTNAANGRYDLTFALFNASSGCCQVGATITNTALLVTNGIFTLTLDFGSGPYSGTNLWLEIAARTNGNGAFLTFTTRQPLTPSPYALFAPTAGGVTSGAISNTMLANGSVTSSKLAANAVTSAALTNTISLGSASVNGELDIFHTLAGGPSISLFGASNQISIYDHSDNLEKVRLVATSGLGDLVLNNNFGFQGANLLANFFNGGGLLVLNNTNGQNRAVLDGGSGGGKLNLYNLSSANTVSLNTAGNSWLTGGSLGIGTTTPAATLHVAAGSAGVAPNPNSIVAFEKGSGGYLSILSGAPNETGILFGSPNSAQDAGIIYNNPAIPRGLQFRTAGNFTSMSLDQFADLHLYDAVGFADVVLQPGGGGGSSLFLNVSSVPYLQLLTSSTTGASAYFYNTVKNNATITLLADDGTGNGLITTSVLQITGGADLSEQFDVRDAPDTPRSTLHTPTPGSVVCIDPENPGQLVVSSRPYDRTVAGIVSGAGGIKPGMLMGHQGTLADGKHPIALTGRVYCLADASNGSIQPGDLLTTSATPGHAMKVSDPNRAQGAILGKAMSKLEAGKGLVLVLVTLQ
jgi:hypothetical protein